MKKRSVKVDTQSIDYDLTQPEFQMKLFTLTASGDFDYIEVKYEYQGYGTV